MRLHHPGWAGGKSLQTTTLPTAIKIELTYACNLACSFCYNSNVADTRREKMDTPSAIRVLDRIYESGVRQVRLTGGEPFVHDGFETIVLHARAKGFFVRVNTNGTRLTPEGIGRFRGVVDAFLFSLHELEPANVARVKSLIAACAAAGIEANVNTIISPELVANVDAFADTVEGLPGRWILQRWVPTEAHQDPTAFEAIEVLVERLTNLRRERQLRVEIHGLPLCAADPTRLQEFCTGSLNCGVMDQLVVAPDGTVRPCYSIDVPLGNILTDDLGDMWSRGLSHDIRTLDAFPPVCTRCSLLELCLGGCRYSAGLASGSYRDLDPLARTEKFASILFAPSAQAGSDDPNNNNAEKYDE